MNYVPTTETDEERMIALAMREAEYQIRNHTASSQVITHFLQLGSERARQERKKLEAETQLSQAKVEMIRAQQTSEQLYQEAIAAFSKYRGKQYVEDEEYDE